MTVAVMVLDQIAERITGPMSFRFIVQPLIAIFLFGLKDGRADAKEGASPFIMDLLVHPKTRKRNLKAAFRRLLVPIIIGAILDGIAQYLIYGHIRPGVAVLVGTLIMGVPYALARGITNRIVSVRIKKDNDKLDSDLEEAAPSQTG